MIFACAAHAQTEVENPSNFSVQFSCGAYYPAGIWSPVSIRLANHSGRAIDGVVDIAAGKALALASQVRVLVPAHCTVMTEGVVLPSVKQPKGGTNAGNELAIIDWKGAGGRISHQTLLGLPQSRQKQNDSNAGDEIAPGAVVYFVDPYDRLDVAAIDNNIAAVVREAHGIMVTTAGTAEPTALPHTNPGLAAMQYILLGCAPDDLDADQRITLLNHIRAGATLLIINPPEQASVESSWLAEYLPVQILGRRWIKRVAVGSDHPFVFAKPVEGVEAAAPTADATVVWQDEHYVYAAWRGLGNGRIGFFSLPMEALDYHDNRVQAIWQRMLGTSTPLTIAQRQSLVVDQTLMEKSPERGRAGSSIRPQLAQLLGTGTPSWTIAAVTVGIYLLLLAASQLIWRGPQRPRGVAVLGIASGAICLILLAATFFIHHGDPVVVARLSDLEFGGDGSGVQRDTLAMLGPAPSAMIGENTPDVSLTPTDRHAWIRPLEITAQQLPVAVQPPLSISDAGLRPADFANIWQTVSPIAGDVSVAASFDDRGLRLHFHNGLPQKINSPVLVWDATTIAASRNGEMSTVAFGLDTIPRGDSSQLVEASRLNPSGVVVQTAGLDPLQNLRTQRILEMLQPHMPGLDLATTYINPQVMGWLDESQPLPVNIGAVDEAAVRRQGLSLVRMPLHINAAAVGSDVKILGAFNQFVRSHNGSTPPFLTADSIVSIQSGNWKFAVLPPAAIGRIRPIHAQIVADVEAPNSTLKIAVKGSKPLLTFDKAIGRQNVAFDVDPSNLDADGLLELQLDVQGEKNMNGLMPQWLVRQLSVSLQGTVTAPPVQVMPLPKYDEPGPKIVPVQPKETKKKK